MSERLAVELLRIAESLTEEVGSGIERSEFVSVSRVLENMRNRFEATSDAAIFLSICRDMSVHISRGNKSSLIRYCREMMEEFGR